MKQMQTYKIVEKKIYLIDFLRLIAAFIVVLYHSTYRCSLSDHQYLEKGLEFPFLKFNLVVSLLVNQDILNNEI